MNILDLKRVARGHTYRWNDRGTDSSGTGSANTGGDNSGGMSGMSDSSSGGGSSSRSSSSNYNDAGDYVGMGSLSYGLNPGDEGYGLGTGGLRGGDGTKFGSGSVGGPDMGPKPDSRMSDLKETFRDNPALGFLANIPGIRQVATLAGFLTAAADYISPRQRQTLAEQAGITEQDFADAKEAVSSGSEAKFDTNFSAAGSTAPGTTPKAAGPMDDIFSQFAGGSTGFTMPTMPEFDADPSGMIAGAKGYMDDYNATYKPYAQKMMAEVDRYGSPEYQAQQRGMAMADVQQQYDNGMRQNTREMARMGVNPSSGRMAAMRNQGAIQSAAAKVNAAAKAEGMAKTAYMSGLGAVNSMGMDTAKMGQGWAAMGNDAAKTKMAYNMGAAEFGLKGQVAGMDNARGWGQIAANRYATDKGITQTQMNNDAKSKSDNMGVYGLIAQSVLKPSKSNWWNLEEDEE